MGIKIRGEKGDRDIELFLQQGNGWVFLKAIGKDNAEWDVMGFSENGAFSRICYLRETSGFKIDSDGKICEE